MNPFQYNNQRCTKNACPCIQQQLSTNQFNKSIKPIQNTSRCNKIFQILFEIIIVSIVMNISTQIQCAYGKPQMQYLQQLRKIPDFRYFIDNMEDIIEDFKYQQDRIFQFNDIQKQYMQVEQKIMEYFSLLHIESIQEERIKLQNLFHSQNIQTLHNIIKQLENQVLSSIYLSRQYIEKSQQIYSNINEIYGNQVPSEVASKFKIQECIDEEIKKQKMEQKTDLFYQINQIKMKFQREHQILNRQ